jgi:hypothetical protein
VKRLVVVPIVAAVLIVAGCQVGATHMATSCQLDNQPPVQCVYDWQTGTGQITYTGLAPGPHTVTVRATKWTLVSKNPDTWKGSSVGEASRSWTVAAP